MGQIQQGGADHRAALVIFRLRQLTRSSSSATYSRDVALLQLGRVQSALFLFGYTHAQAPGGNALTQHPRQFPAPKLTPQFHPYVYDNPPVAMQADSGYMSHEYQPPPIFVSTVAIKPVGFMMQLQFPDPNPLP